MSNLNIRGGNVSGKVVNGAQEAWSMSGAVVVSTPFAAAQGLPPEVWNAISILLGAAR